MRKALKILNEETPKEFFKRRGIGSYPGKFMGRPKKTNISKSLQIAILKRHPCPECGTVRVLPDSVDFRGLVGATCECGRSEGANCRWDLSNLARGPFGFPMAGDITHL